MVVPHGSRLRDGFLSVRMDRCLSSGLWKGCWPKNLIRVIIQTAAGESRRAFLGTHSSRESALCNPANVALVF